MKRDMELVRKILFSLENSNNTSKWALIQIDGYRPNEVSYHLKLLSQAGLVEAKDLDNGVHSIWVAKSLTWDGHEFLASIDDDTVWAKVKGGIKSKGLELGQISFGVLKEYAKMELKKTLGLETK
ncbi:DUF2513 domain-containing protein [Rossellomorea marisflavi]|uniref:DUF2513 domain-containing protein n=1 Tax=Rossellomorea marisflavi TaxID=189381 RepID=UPI002079F284|nr:DUF2513 domain-containing protein [Rossellomorea marisflavi]USK91502.1 DUF2513 domain-containing protein [Rossellomorea marisflavi]